MVPSLDWLRRRLLAGGVIPAHPLALTPKRQLDARRQQALTRYYLDSGAAGLAVGVHTTQFGIRDPKVGLLAPVLELAATATRDWVAGSRSRAPLLIAGVVGHTRQAAREARVARDLGYNAVLLSLGALPKASTDRLIAHAEAVGEVLPLMGFYLQPSVGGRPLSYTFWRRFCELEAVVAIKVAPFNRYETLEVVRAVADSGRAREIALYTGNDDHILLDLLTTHQMATASGEVKVRMAGGLLGQWACWTHTAVRLDAQARRAARARTVPRKMLTLAAQLTEANAAIFDAANGFRGCIPGIHEVLRRQGLLRGRWCLDPSEELSPGQLAMIDRLHSAYPWLADDTFVREHLDRWLR